MSRFGGGGGGVKVGGQGLGRGQGLGSRLWSRLGVKIGGQGRGQGCRIKVRGMTGGHKVGLKAQSRAQGCGLKVGGSKSGGQCLGEGVKVRGMRSRSGELGSDGRWCLVCVGGRL